ncbi:MAG: hypothetical protein IJ497_05030 [Clostridia bacterium]|nr:hypothetical protein [Clostridia bacterium]
MNRLDKNIQEAVTALTERPMLAADAERILISYDLMQGEWDPFQPASFADAISAILDRVSVPLEDYDLIAGRSVERELTEEEEAKFAELQKSPRSPYRGPIIGSGHCSYDWEMVMEYGLPGLIEKARASMEQKTDDGRRRFLASLIRVYEAIQRYMLRYADAADERGMTDLAVTLRKAATEKPADFRTGLQLLWIITLIDCSYVTANPTLTLGRMDKLLYPLYKADLDAGRITRGDAADLITDYYCKHNLNMGRGEHQLGDNTNSTTFQRIFNFDAPQYLLLGGTDIDGNYTVNELTSLFAECIQPAFKNPVVVFYYAPGMNTAYPELWRTLTGKALASSSLMIYNDANSKKTYRALGLPEEDFQNYHHFGCNWPSPSSESFWLHGAPSSLNFGVFESKEEMDKIRNTYIRIPGSGWPDVFVNFLKNHRDDPDVTLEVIYREYEQFMDDFISQKVEKGIQELRVRRRKPWNVSNFTDCFTKAPIERGECFSACAKYIFTLQSFQMFGTLCDCFAVVDALCFREKKLTIGELLDAVADNFEGHEQILAMCRGVPKYGSDDAYSNAHVARLAGMMAEITRKRGRKYLESDGYFLVPCLQSDTWHLKNGLKYGATPDGRLAGTAFTQNSRPANGSCTNGLTAMFNSMLHIPDDGYLSGALNLDVDPKQFEGESGHTMFAAMLAVYLNRGGLHAQVTSVSADDLIDAQKNPHLHRDLRVRVTGYSGVFVDITKTLQDDIIERLK